MTRRNAGGNRRICLRQEQKYDVVKQTNVEPTFDTKIYFSDQIDTNIQ